MVGCRSCLVLCRDAPYTADGQGHFGETADLRYDMTHAANVQHTSEHAVRHCSCRGCFQNLCSRSDGMERRFGSRPGSGIDIINAELLLRHRLRWVLSQL